MSNEENNNTQEEVVLTAEQQNEQHEQAMIDKVDANDAKTDDSLKTDQEKMLAGKYKSVEELEKAYEHLQTKLSTQENEETTEEPAEYEEAGKEEAEAIATEAGIDYQGLEAEYQDTGELSADTYNMLAEAGIPEEMVNAYIAGQEALTQTTVQKMYDIAGGENEYQDMISWATDSLSENEVEAFNSSLMNESTAEFAIQGLTARFNADKGPNLVRGSQSISRTGGFNSKAEMMRDMANPQYQQDPAFRAEVQRRVAVSDFQFMGNLLGRRVPPPLCLYTNSQKIPTPLSNHILLP